MKKMHALKKAILCLLAAVLLIFASVCAFYGMKGYRMYREAISDASIKETVEEIREEEDFTAYSELPKFYIDAVVSVEDRRFWKHPGIDPIAVCRAALVDIRAMSFREGGSTITQQLVKNLFFTREKKLERKAAEVFAVLDVEGSYSKEEIFELYVNTINFGSGYQGIYKAAAGYLGKKPLEMTDGEAAMLAGLPNAPADYSPDINAALTAQRTKQVLDSMVNNHLLTQEKADLLQSGMGEE